MRRKALRSFQGGKLKTSGGNFLPFNGAGSGGVGISLENAPNAQSRFYVAGDIRVCENANLAALHALFLREHNLVGTYIPLIFKSSLCSMNLGIRNESVSRSQMKSVELCQD